MRPPAVEGVLPPAPEPFFLGVLAVLLVPFFLRFNLRCAVCRRMRRSLCASAAALARKASSRYAFMRLVATRTSSCSAAMRAGMSAVAASCSSMRRTSCRCIFFKARFSATTASSSRPRARR